MSSNAVILHWTGEGLRFRGGREGGPEILVDTDGEAGPSPMDSLLLGLAGCMGIDVVMILEKGRVPLDALSVRVEGDRPEDPPRRFTAVRMTYRISGPPEKDHGKVERAVALSREKYCSVLHTLQPDLGLEIDVEYV